MEWESAQRSDRSLPKWKCVCIEVRPFAPKSTRILLCRIQPYRKYTHVYVSNLKELLEYGLEDEHLIPGTMFSRTKRGRKMASRPLKKLRDQWLRIAEGRDGCEPPSATSE